MTTQRADAWKKVRSAGTVNLVVGIIEVIGTVFFILIAIFLIIINTDIPSEDGAPLPSSVLGIILLVVGVIFLAPLAILDIVAGVKMRKPVPRPKGWVIYTIVVGVVGISSITGILQTIFGILALTSLSDIEQSKPPVKTK